ncbi:MAG: sulfatase-like hydrolase/transferase [Fuerstiella sp.]|nr:sulfatase-like hydrolase/transferase [Fuerstiella sp.]
MRSTLLLAFSWFVGASAYAADPPNVLIYLADDQYLSSVGCYGADPSHTPNIDRLAREGARFIRCFTPSSICTPNRGVLLSGMYPLRNGAHPNHSGFIDGIKSLPNYMKDAGYRACIVGKDGIQKPSDLYHWEFRIEKSDHPVPGATEEKHARHRKTNFDEVKRFLSSGDKRPFCIFHAASLPHGPELNQIPNGLSGYNAANHYMDHELGVYLELLKDNQLDRKTLVIYLNDNEAQLKRTKYTLYDTGVRVPMAIRWPGYIRPGTTIDTMVSTVDVLPTLLDIIGATIPTDSLPMDGISMRDVWTGKSDLFRKELFFSYTGVIVGKSGRMETPYPVRAIRTDRFKYIRYLNHRIGHPKYKGQVFPKEEFFDLSRDPNEQINLADSDAHVDARRLLSHRLDEWMSEMNDRGIESELESLRRYPRRK